MLRETFCSLKHWESSVKPSEPGDFFHAGGAGDEEILLAIGLVTLIVIELFKHSISSWNSFDKYSFVGICSFHKLKSLLA